MSFDTSAGRSRGRIIGWAGILLAVSVSCTTLTTSVPFDEELASSPPEAGLIIPLPATGGDLRNSFAAVDVLVRFWKKKPVGIPDRAARESVDEQPTPVGADITRLLTDRNLWSFAFYGTLNELEIRLREGVPILVVLQSDAVDPESRRYAVVYGINTFAEKVLVYEGDRGSRTYTFTDFRRAWRPVKNWLMVIAPPDRITWAPRLLEQVSLARYQERKGDWNRALVEYERALQQEPLNAVIRLTKADTLFFYAESPASLAIYRDILASDEMNARAANNLAYVFAATDRNLDEAEHLVRRALVIEPSNPVFLDTLGYVLIKTGRQHEAARVLARAFVRMDALSRDSQRAITRRLMQAYEESGQPHLARQVLDDYRVRDPVFLIDEDGQTDGNAEQSPQ